MDSFIFRSPEVGDLSIQQESTRAIGFKVYPGALLLVDFFQRELLGSSPSGRCPGLGPGARVLEVGAGVCGIPSLFLALQGRNVVATDAPDVVPLLAANIAANAPPERTGAQGGSCTAAPLWWGNAEHTAALLTDHGPLDAIIAADVVYHEHLIDPLLAALVALTDAKASPGRLPPPIVLSYVQRFKRAKAFFKKAKKWFDVVAYQYKGLSAGWVAVDANSGREEADGAGAEADVEACIDYDALCWNHPEAGGTASKVVLEPSSVDYQVYLRSLVAAAASKRDSSEESSSSSNSAKDSAADAPSGGAVKWHAVDSDTDEEEEAAAAAAVGHGLFAATACEDVFSEGGAGGAVAEDDHTALAGGSGHSLGPARAAARALGLRLADPMKGYVYVFTRR